MRIVTVLVCLPLAACAGGGLPGNLASPAPAEPAAMAAPAATTGQRTAPAPTPEEPAPDPVAQARIDCWMKVEHQKFARDIDKRIAFVDKCLADRLKAAR